SGKNGLRFRNIIRLTPDIGDFHTRLFTDDAAGRHIPGLERKLPKPIKTTRSYITKIQSSRAQAAHTLREFCEFYKIGKIIPPGIPGIVWKTGHQQALL